MAIIVEDGTGLANANSFISVAGADAYWAEVTTPTLWSSASTPEKEAALVQATRYMEKRFGTRYKGSRASSAQALAFPRTGLYDETGEAITGLPTSIARACAEYALASRSNPLIPPVVYPVADGSLVGTGPVQRKLEKVGPLTEETYFATSGANASKVGSGSALVDANKFVQYPDADLLVSPFLRARGTVMRA
jgi:hypothetical protein